MSDLLPFRVQECGEGGCSCGGACGGDGAGKSGKRGKRRAKLQKLAEAWGVSPKPGGMAAPKRQRGSGATPPKLPGLGGGTPATATAKHGGDNSVSRPPTPPTPPQAKMARPPVRRWDGASKRPRIGGALSAKGRKTLTEGELQEYNPYHGKGGRFASKGQAVQTVAYAGKRPGGFKSPAQAGKAEAARRSGPWAPTDSPFMRQAAAAKAKAADDFDGGDGLRASHSGTRLARAARGSGLTRKERAETASRARSEINAARASRGQGPLARGKSRGLASTRKRRGQDNTP